jgi:hypothetical protein
MRIIVFLIISLLITGCFNCDKWLKANVYPKEIKGIVVSKIISTPCFGSVVILSFDSTKFDTLNLCNCGLNKPMWDSIEVRDSFIKPVNSNVFTLKHEAQQDASIDFKYPCCDH